MKKIIKLSSLVLAMLMLITGFTACDPYPDDEYYQNNPDVTVRVAGMTGPTGIGLVSLMDKSEKKEAELNYEFSLYASAQEIVPLLVKGELDIAAVPANLAAIQFNNNN